ncbi:leucine-rich repeat extensin-like protein 6 [Chenopodium quinoa]|uniref:leucine-rich repeat extensin-like protein 6 n=1 Tax=Chenopodium quinoa TaxID=63459 RepID=UPI000B791D78|nr:leucine-rich repeat extensin-like protein 6 [Chenopodium quinoa]
MRTNLKSSIILALWATFSLLLSFPTPSLQQPQVTPSTGVRLQNAYVALQAWKKLINSDPNGFTSNWNGYDVCSYKGVYCANAPDDSYVKTVAGIDLNHGNISGSLPEELGLLTDLALLHLNSNRFFGTIPSSFSHLKLLHEIDLSNNLFCGEFPKALLCLSSLKFLDIRYNHFEGSIPSAVFDLKLDALFLNNNNFSSTLPTNLANSPVSVFVVANNNLNGCFPSEITKMGATLQEIILMNAGLKGCLPSSIGELNKATVFDVSYNELTGTLPESMGKMESLEQLNVAHNKFYGKVPYSICSLPKLENFTYSYNYFCGEPLQCMRLQDKDDKYNCLPLRPYQRSPEECTPFLAYPPNCNSFGCQGSPSPLPPPPPPPSPPPPSQYNPHEQVPYNHIH